MAIGTSLAGAGTMALFTSVAATSNNNFSAGTLKIELDKPNTPQTAYFNITNMAPGDSNVQPVVISNKGSLQFKYKLSLTEDGFLGTHDANHLTLTSYATLDDANKGLNPIDLTQYHILDSVGTANGKSSETLYIKASLPLNANNDYQNQSGTATISVNAEQTAHNDSSNNPPPSNNNLQSKAITNFDFSASFASQANQRSKTMLSTDFRGNNAKSFTISDGTTTIPINLYWNIPLSGFSIGQVIGSAVDSSIQDYCNAHGIPLGNRTMASFGFGDTFSIATFKTGSNATITFGGKDWQYFFQNQSFSGSNNDTSNNRSFTISDGTHIASISLTSKYTNLDDLIGDLNGQLTNAQVSATASKVDVNHFQLVPSASGIPITVDGTNANDLF
jgi:predicted ribosomally synthesized peptide with SipW-like signal peptide